MFTTAAFLESVDPAGVFNALTAIPDQHMTQAGDDLRVPSLSQLVAVAAGVESAAAHRARLVSPSLRGFANLQITPLNTAAAAAVEPGSPQAIMDRRRSPLALVVGEDLNAEVLSDPVAAQIQWVVIWLADGPIEPVSGPFRTVRAVGGTALVGSVWSLTALAFDEDLPRGRYEVVGFRPMSDGMVAARLVFPEGGVRPGALGVDATSDLQSDIFRLGNFGAFGQFESTSPPQVEALSVSADAAANQQFFLDLLQVRAGPA